MHFNLERFKSAQSDCYPRVLTEIRNGKKQTHWMWFIFPQIGGLGKSPTTIKYEIANIEEAKAYLKDELLSKRLLELSSILAYIIQNKTAEEIFGYPDYLKFHSSLTLFHLAVMASDESKSDPTLNCFRDALGKYFDGRPDRRTMEILESQGKG